MPWKKEVILLVFVASLLISTISASFTADKLLENEGRVVPAKSQWFDDPSEDWLLFSENTVSLGFTHSKSIVNRSPSTNNKSKTKLRQISTELRFGPYGGDEGTPWDGNDTYIAAESSIKRVVLSKFNDDFYGIAVTYVDGSVLSEGILISGTTEEINLQKDEYIEFVKIGTDTHLRFLELTTSHGNKLSVGDSSSSSYEYVTVPPRKGRLIYFFGMNDIASLVSLGCAFGKPPALPTPKYQEYEGMTREEFDSLVTTMGPYGKKDTSGVDFSDADICLSSAAPIEKVQIFTDDSHMNINNINVIYADGTSTGRTSAGDEIHELQLEEFEHIIYVRFWYAPDTGMPRAIELGTDQSKTLLVGDAQDFYQVEYLKSKDERLLFFTGCIDSGLTPGLENLGFGFGPAAGLSPAMTPVDYTKFSWTEYEDITIGVSPVGPMGGQQFDDKYDFYDHAHSPIKSITVYSSTFIHSLYITYENGFVSRVRGGSGGNPTKLELNADEHINSIELKYDNLLRHIRFETTKDRSLTVGVEQGSETGTVAPSSEGVLLYLQGRVNQMITALGGGFGPPPIAPTLE